MNQKYIEKLEFPKVIDVLKNFCITNVGKNFAKNLQPQKNKDIVLNLLEETSEATSLLYKKHTPSIFPFEDMDDILKTLEINGILSAKSLLEVSKILKMATSLKKYYFTDNEDEISCFPILSNYFSNLYTNPSLQEKIEKSIQDELNLYDDASLKLASLRKSQRNLEDTIKNRLNSFIHSSCYSKYIQESVITLRNNRYVIPVKEEYRSMIKGFIHDISSSGSTVFMEPLTIFEFNNQMTSLKAEETLEIENILLQLSSMFYPLVEELRKDIEIIGKIDFILAKAKYAIELDAICPKLNNEKWIHLLGARHPFIDKQLVVPIDIELGKSFSTLVITGPNTGGKTVTLKTVGLLTLMACSGLHIPANNSSSIYIFDDIYADIGDEQSIQESLSTFSSHMRNIIDILNISTSNSLILLDELGSRDRPY